MSKAANKTVIGAFVLGAVVLAVAAVLIFGSGKFLTKRLTYELYFEGSVQGLDIGSPVIFRGVKIGSVTDIALEFQPSQLEFYVPVTIEVEPDKINSLGPAERKGQKVKGLIDKGLRGQLQTMSLVTGQLAVSLDFFPEKPVQYAGLRTKYPEIPTVPTKLAALTKTLQDLPIQQLFARMDSALESINKLVSSDSAQSSMKSLDQALVQARALMKNLDSRIGPLIASLQNTSEGINSATTKLNVALSGDKGLPVQVQLTLEAARKALAQAEQTFASVQEVTQQNSTMGYELGTAMGEMSKSMRSVRALTDYLERHPEAILWGKKAS
jgi:paraquat-inducible protein B